MTLTFCKARLTFCRVIQRVYIVARCAVYSLNVHPVACVCSSHAPTIIGSFLIHMACMHDQLYHISLPVSSRRSSFTTRRHSASRNYGIPVHSASHRLSHANCTVGRKLGTEVGVNSCLVALIGTKSVSIALSWLLLPPEVSVNRRPNLFTFLNDRKKVKGLGQGAVQNSLWDNKYTHLKTCK